MLKTLVDNSRKSLDEQVYDIHNNLNQSKIDLLSAIQKNNHASLITEIKFSSPSLGSIRNFSNPVEIAEKMISGGALALSVLTQPYLFNGSPSFFMEIRKKIQAPMLMKDIIIDTKQIDAAKNMGADYILLIQSIFDKRYLKNHHVASFIEYAHEKKLKVLLEVHTKEEFSCALETDADIIGINNRNLDTLEIDLNTTKKILDGFDGKRTIISESGIETVEHIRFLKESGANGFLIGSSIMKDENIEYAVNRLVNAI